MKIFPNIIISVENLFIIYPGMNYNKMKMQPSERKMIRENIRKYIISSMWRASGGCKMYHKGEEKRNVNGIE